MVARIVSGKSVRGILSYNEMKIKNAEAQLLMAAGYPRNIAELSFNDKLERFETLTRQNERTKTNALHITLNFSREDSVDDDRLCIIASDYMDEIGFGGQPFLVYRHYDAAHPHIHIVTVNIADGGQRIETHNIGKYQSEKARKAIEERYGLIKAENQKKEATHMLQPVKLEEVVYGKAETKSAISRTVREVVDSYKFTSLPELNAVLKQFNVLANPGNPGSRMYEKGGLTYHLINERGEKVGVPIKASSIYSSPTLKNLEKKYDRNKQERKPYSVRLRHLLDKMIAEVKDVEEMQERLEEQGIRILLRQNVMGNIYGVTFIDNGTRSVFNGSSLGKQYRAKAFLQKIGFDVESLHRQEFDNTHVPRPFPATGLPVIEQIADTTSLEEYDIADDRQSRKNKKSNRLQVE